jgi:PKD repeat protein
VAGTVIAVLAVACALAPSAGAVLVKIDHHRPFGVIPVKGVRPSSIPGSLANSSSTSGTDTGAVQNVNSGPVLHGSTPYLVFWDPSNGGTGLTAADRSLFERYFADVAANSGGLSNVFGVDRQYYDSSGFADYRQMWSNSNAILDTNPYPTSGQCTATPQYDEPTCLTDGQIQAEVTRLIAADNLPTGVGGDAPVYFVVTPPTVNSCLPATGPAPQTCADHDFCAYHSSFSDGHANVVYADIPTVLALNDPKGCQADGNPEIQSPNSNSLVDVALKYLSHEDTEAITDPLGTAWYDPISGNEIGDNCNITGPVNLTQGTNPNAFKPTIGGSPTGQPYGSLYDQRINNHHYYTQSVWSNGDRNCVMLPTQQALTPAFTAPAVVSQNQSFVLNPSASSSSGGYSSATWNFGDGNTWFALGSPAQTTHTYTTPGTYRPTLTLVDQYGNLSTTSQTITTPIPSFTSSQAKNSNALSFDGSGSSEPGGSISSYSWNFGDGSPASTGAAPSHTYASQGIYDVSLTVTDNTGHTATISQEVSVHGLPTAAFHVTTQNPQAGPPAVVSFDGSASSEPYGSLTYSWNFGDGSAPVTGVASSHTYTQAGIYTVALTVTDTSGNTASTSQTITVASVPTAAFTSSPDKQTATVDFSDTSSDIGSTISTYNWSFGDGTNSTAESPPPHTYPAPGQYTVSLTITDATGNTNMVSQTVNAHGPPSASFNITTTDPMVGSPVSFDGSASTEPFGSIASYSWTFGDGSTSTAQSPSHTYTQAGTYTVALTVTDTSGNTANTSQSITVASVPTAAFTSSPDPQTATVDFSDTSNDVGSNIISYSWNFGDQTNFTGERPPPHTYPAPGQYTVSLKITDATGNTNTVWQTVNAHGPPSASFNMTIANPLVGSPVSFDGSASSEPFGSIASYSWNFGDGSPSGSGATPSHTYARAGTYTVALTVTDGTGNKSLPTTKTITVHGGPMAAITASITQPLTVALSAAFSTDVDSTITSYSWNFGDGSTSAAQSPNHIYASPGVYTVSLTVTDARGATDTTWRTVTIHGPPSAALAINPARPTAGAPVVFSGSASSEPFGSISSYSWTFGDGSTGSGASVSHRYSKPGIYTVTLRITDAAGAGAAASTTVQVKNPAITAVSVRKGTKAERVTLTVSGGGTLKLGSRKFKILGPENFVLTVRPSTAQTASLAQHRRVTITLKLKFVPTFGNASRRTVVIKLRR